MLDKNGFKRKTYSDLVTDMSAKAKELFGANAKLTEKSALGILIRIMAWFLSLAWMAIEQVYHAGYRKSAEGAQLDKLLPLAGTQRILADYAYGEIEITGTSGHTVESGFLVSKGDIQFQTTSPVTLDSSGKGTVEIVALQIGPSGNVEANSITQIVNTDANVTSVTNPEATTNGRDKESDQSARDRSNITVEGMGSGTPASIRTAVLEVPNVRAARVIENYEDEVDEYGTPSRAFQTFVLGGDDTAIAEAILSKKAGGIRPHGSVYVTVNDISGTPKRVGFTRATEIDIIVRAVITVDNSFGINGENEVRDAIVKYIGGTDSTGQVYAGLNMGERVYYSQLIKSVTVNVPGIIDVDIEVSLDGNNYSSSNVDISPNEVAQIVSSDIEVIRNV